MSSKWTLRKQAALVLDNLAVTFSAALVLPHALSAIQIKLQTGDSVSDVSMILTSQRLLLKPHYFSQLILCYSTNILLDMIDGIPSFLSVNTSNIFHQNLGCVGSGKWHAGIGCLINRMLD